MTTTVDRLGLYLHLARASRMRRRPLVRDRMLVLAGMLAHEAELPRIAAACRREILVHNPNHVVGRYASLADAAEDEAFQTFHRRLSQRFPPEKAEHMLNSLGIERAQERASYFDDEEYAASLLGVPKRDLEVTDDPLRKEVETNGPFEGGVHPANVAGASQLPAWTWGAALVLILALAACGAFAWGYFGR